MDLVAVPIIGRHLPRHRLAETNEVAFIRCDFYIAFTGMGNFIDKTQRPIMGIPVYIHPSVSFFGSRKNSYLQAGQKSPSCEARADSTSGGVLMRHVGARRTSATKQMGFFQQPVHFTPYFAITSSINPL